MSATRKPAPSEVGAGSMGAAIQYAAGKLPEGWQVQISLEQGSGWAELFNPDGANVTHGADIETLDLPEAIARCVQYAMQGENAVAQSGAPLQPGATQPEHDGVAHETAPMTAAHIPLGGSVEHRLYSETELTTLLERMARLMVQEAAHSINEFLTTFCALEPYMGRLYGEAFEKEVRDIRALLTPEKLQQLREAVERT